MMAHGLAQHSAKCLQIAPLIFRQETEVLFTIFCSWEFLSGITQCLFDTLNAPADKLLLAIN
jgi:hypothetical protein